MSISTREFVEKCKKLTSSASIVSRAAVLYWFRFRVPPREEVHGIITGTSFLNRTDATIPCTVPTLISPYIRRHRLKHRAVNLIRSAELEGTKNALVWGNASQFDRVPVLTGRSGAG